MEVAIRIGCGDDEDLVSISRVHFLAVDVVLVLCVLYQTLSFVLGDVVLAFLLSEKSSVSIKSIGLDVRLLLFLEPSVKAARNFPLFSSLFKDKGDLVVPRAYKSVFLAEASLVDGEVSSVHLGGLFLHGDLGVIRLIEVKVAEVDFRVMGCDKGISFNGELLTAESEVFAGKRESHEVDPSSDVKSVKHSVEFLSHVSEGAGTAIVVVVFIVRRPDLDDSIHAAGSEGSARPRIVSNTVDCLLVVALFLLNGNPHLHVRVKVALADHSR